MSYLHSRGILHGDLTGGNVLLASSTKDARMFTAMVRNGFLSSFLSVLKSWSCTSRTVIGQHDGVPACQHLSFGHPHSSVVEQTAVVPYFRLFYLTSLQQPFHHTPPSLP